MQLQFAKLAFSLPSAHRTVLCANGTLPADPDPCILKVLQAVVESNTEKR